jgi:DNA-binding response OmpR family regulator
MRAGPGGSAPNVLVICPTATFLRALRGGTQQATLNILTTRPGKVFSVIDLMAQVYADDPKGGPEYGSNYIRTCIMKLRRKGYNIVTEYSRGYRFEP